MAKACRFLAISGQCCCHSTRVSDIACAQAVRQPLPTAEDSIADPRAREQLFFYSMQYDHTRTLHFEDCWLPSDCAPAGPARWKVRG